MPDAADTDRSPGRRRARARRRVWAFVWAATACAVGGALAMSGVLRPASPLSELVVAVGQLRTVEARLTGGFTYAALSTPRRGSQSTGIGWRVLAAAAKLQDAINVSPTPANLHALGVAALQATRYDDAVLAIEDALSGDADNTAYLSDLSAAYLARLANGGPAIDVTKALTAADRAVRLDPRRPEAHFNRALALDALHLRHEATLAWDEYLQTFGQEAGWSDEARRRRDRAAAEVTPIAPSPAARAEQILDEWAAVAVKTPDDAFLPVLNSPDTFYADLGTAIGGAAGEAKRALAQSVRDLRAADAALTRAEYTSADAFAAQALSRASKIAPIALWARRHQVTAAFFAGRAAKGRREAERLSPQLKARGYRALESDLHLRIAAFDYSAGGYDTALAGYERAIAIRESIGDGKGAASARLAAAEALRALGRVPEAWEHYTRVLAAGAIGDPGLEQLRLVSPATGGLNGDTPAVTLALVREATHLAEGTDQPGYAAVAGYLEARALARLGDLVAAEQRLLAARTAFEQVADASAKKRILPELAFAEAEILGGVRPAAALGASRQAEQGFGSNSTRHRLLALAVLEARAHRTAGNPVAAEAALLKGVAIVEQQQQLIGRADFLPSFIDASWDVFSELVDLKASLNDAGAALRWLDRGYDLGRHWQSQAGSVSWADVSAAGPVVAYLSRPEALWMWVVRDGAVRQRRVPVTQRALVNRAARMSRLLALSGAGEALRAEAAAMASEMLWPATEGLNAGNMRRLALVLDPVLQPVPFALLPWAKAADERVLDVTATVICPSVTACASLLEPGGVSRERVAALYSAAGLGGLAALPFARTEAERVGRRYAGATVEVASESAVISELGRADLMHFVGHAEPDERYPRRSALVMTDAVGQGVRVPLTRILAGPITAQTVLLSACRTSTAEQRRGHGGTGVAGEFLRAGVRHVVATQWDVQDQAASDVMDLVHEALAAGALPWDAVRHAQQVVSDDAARRPRDWAGYVAFTASSVPTSATVSDVSMPPQAERP